MSADENDPLLQALNADQSNTNDATTTNDNKNDTTTSAPSQPSEPVDPERERALSKFKDKLLEHRKWDARLKELRLSIRDLDKDYEKTENDIKALQSVGQIIGEVLKQLDDERFIVKASSGPRYIVGCRTRLKKKT